MKLVQLHLRVKLGRVYCLVVWVSTLGVLTHLVVFAGKLKAFYLKANAAILLWRFYTYFFIWWDIINARITQENRVYPSSSHTNTTWHASVIKIHYVVILLTLVDMQRQIGKSAGKFDVLTHWPFRRSRDYMIPFSHSVTPKHEINKTPNA